MKLIRFIGLWFLISCLMIFYSESEAVRPPLKPLGSEQLQKMAADADMIAVGTVISVRQSKTLQPPLETVTVHVAMAPEKILKGDQSSQLIKIEESYQQFFMPDIEIVPDGRNTSGKPVIAHIAGPAPPVGKYQEGDRVMVFLKFLNKSDQYCPLGSGNHDAYLGVFYITAEGVVSDKYRFSGGVAGYAKYEADFINYIISNRGETP